MSIDAKNGVEYDRYDDIDKDLAKLKAILESGTLSKERIDNKFSALASQIESKTSNSDDIYFYNSESSFDPIREAGYKKGVSKEKIEKG